MSAASQKHAPAMLVVLAFAIVYLVWGSTYLFIRIAIQSIPALVMAGMRFFSAGLLLLVWCAIRGERLISPALIRPAIVSGLLLLFFGNGAVVWAEQFLPSSFVAVLTAASPIWVVILDQRNRAANFSHKATLAGLVLGFTGVIMLFSEHVSGALHNSEGNRAQLGAMGILVVGAACWAGGSLYSKYRLGGISHSVATAWQMLTGGAAFFLVGGISGEWSQFHPQQVSVQSWLSLLYLISFGSLAGYSAYTWLLQVRPATQVSTHAYVNPVVAVLLGIALAGETLTGWQWGGLAVILLSVLLVNLARYRKQSSNITRAKSLA